MTRIGPRICLKVPCVQIWPKKSKRKCPKWPIINCHARCYKKIKGLIDSGAQVSSISDTFASKLGLEIKQLNMLLDLEPKGGGQVPYDGYVELRM